MGNPEEDGCIETATRFNILSYPLFTIDGAPEDPYESSGPSKSGSGSPPFNPRPWANLSPPLEKPSHDLSCSLIAHQSISQQTAVPIYPAGTCTSPSPHYDYESLPGEGHQPTINLPGHDQNYGYTIRPHEGVKPLIKQEYVENNHCW